MNKVKIFPDDSAVIGNKPLGSYATLMLLSFSERDKLDVYYPVDGINYDKEYYINLFNALLELIKATKKIQTKDKQNLLSLLADIKTSIYLSKSEKANRLIGYFGKLGIVEMRREDYKKMINGKEHHYIKVTLNKHPLLITLQGKVPEL